MRPNRLTARTKGFPGAFSLLSCFLLVLLGFGAAQMDAKVTPEPILILGGTAEPQIANVGDEVIFSADYLSQIPDGSYQLYACKTKAFDSNRQLCRDGAWCESSEFSTDQPLRCSYSATAEEGARNAFSLFVCSAAGVCSAPFTGSFAVAADTLSLEVPALVDFSPMQFSFQAQTNANNPLGDMVITSVGAGGSPSPWSVDVSAREWRDEDDSDTMAFDGDGENTGRLTIDLDGASIQSSGPTSGLTLGETASFSAAMRTINLVRAGKKSKAGVFAIQGINFDQFVPGNQPEGNYQTVLTFTIS